MSDFVLPQHLIDELSTTLRLFLEHPPFLKDEADSEMFGEALAESPKGMLCGPMLLDIMQEWMALSGKVLMFYAILGVQVTLPEPPTEFVKKLVDK